MQREVSLQDCSLANCLHTKPCVISRFFEHIFAFFLHATPRLPRSISTARAAPRPPTQHLDRPHSSSTARTAPRPPAQCLDRPRSTSTTDTAHRPHAQHLDQRAAHRPSAQLLDRQHNTSATAQHLDHRHSTSTTDTAHRPPAASRPHRHALSNRFSHFFSLHRGKIQQQLIVLLE